ncbi:MAG: CsbD family protein [Ilumatobacteraceae bacterium]
MGDLTGDDEMKAEGKADEAGGKLKGSSTARSTPCATSSTADAGCRRKRVG